MTECVHAAMQVWADAGFVTDMPAPDVLQATAATLFIQATRESLHRTSRPSVGNEPPLGELFLHEAGSVDKDLQPFVGVETCWTQHDFVCGIETETTKAVRVVRLHL